MKGLGVDVVEIRRIRGPSQARLAARILSPREKKLMPKGSRGAEFLAGRFAAKEAVLKCLGTGLAAGVRWHDVEVLADRRGAPSIALSGAAARQTRRRKIRTWLLSISHTRDLALAIAIGQ